MLKHDSSNIDFYNKNQYSYDFINSLTKTISGRIESTKILLKIIKILSKHKINTSDDIEKIECKSTKNFLKKNKYITYTLIHIVSEKVSEAYRYTQDIIFIPLYSNFSERWASEYTTSIVSHDTKTHKYCDDNEIKKFAQKNNIEEPTTEELKEVQKQLNTMLWHNLIGMRPAEKTLLNAVENDLLMESRSISKSFIESFFYITELRNTKSTAYILSSESKQKTTELYKITTQSLEESFWNLKQLLNSLTQLLEVPKLYLVPTPNHVPKATNKKQKGVLNELDDRTHEARALLKQKILEDLSLTEEQKNDFIEKINSPSTNTTFELDRYLGSKLDQKVNVVLRAVRAIVFEAVQSKEAESPHHPIKFSTHKLYELCGVKKHVKGGYHSEQTKSIINILTKSSLTEKILVKNEYDRVIKSTSFILETTFHSNKVEIKKNRKKELLSESIIQEQITHITIKISDFLFANHINQLENCYLQDIEGYIRFRTQNETVIGNQLFLWLEIYLSRTNKIKEVNLSTLIKELMLEERYKSHSKEVKICMERALKEMIELRTLITDYKLVIGARGQEKYIFTNARYLQKPNLEMIKTENKKSTKGRKTMNKISHLSVAALSL